MSKSNGKATHMIETVPIAELRPHPRNYRNHPDDQLDHLIESIKEHGLYRNVVIARDGTILAGHGVVKAAGKMGLTAVPVIRLDITPDDSRALKVLTGDNEIEHLAEQDDRLLSELLKEIRDFDIDGLIGTGYDEMMLANLVYVTRPASEVADFNEAAHWVGMPEYEPTEEPPRGLKVVVNFRDEADKMEFARILGLRFTVNTDTTWWPPKERNDLAAVRFEAKE